MTTREIYPKPFKQAGILDIRGSNMRVYVVSTVMSSSGRQYSSLVVPSRRFCCHAGPSRQFCCSVLSRQFCCHAVPSRRYCYNTLLADSTDVLQFLADCFRVLQFPAYSFLVLQFLANSFLVLQFLAPGKNLFLSPFFLTVAVFNSSFSGC
jgi:hypothetical protein